MRSKLLVASAVAGLLSLPAHPASADPLVITSGWMNVQSYDEFGARLIGTHFDLLVQSLRSGFTQEFYLPGDPIDLSSRVVLDDVELHGSFEGTGRIDFTMTGGSADLPTGPVHNEPGYQEERLFPTPFAFDGRIWGYDATGALAFEAALRGGGSADFIVLAVGPNPPYWTQAGYVLRETRFAFNNAAPVPEPATLLLLGAGATAAMRRAHGRRRSA